MKEDKEAYIAMSHEFYSMDAVLHAIPREHMEETFQLVMDQSPYVKGYMILRGENPAGYGLLSLTHSNEVGGLVVFIEEVFILPVYRGLGLGTEFLEFVKREFSSYARRFRLEVSLQNKQAQELYERLGYKLLTYTQMVYDVE